MDCYIVEFEQNGENRAVYGKQQLKKLEQRLNVKGLDEPSFVMQKDKIIGLGLSTMHHDIQLEMHSFNRKGRQTLPLQVYWQMRTPI